MKSTPPKQSNLIAYPLVKTAEGDLSIPQEYMAQIWLQIVQEGKKDQLFYDGGVQTLQDWINYIYFPENYTVVVIDEENVPRHIAWINRYYQGAAFLHHCSLGKYHRQSWPLVRDHWAGMKDAAGNPLIRVLMGVTPITNILAVRLVKILGWTIIGSIPSLCYLASEDKHVSGVVSYYVLNGE